MQTALSDSRRLMIGAGLTGAGILLGVLLILAEFLNGPREPHQAVLVGTTLTGHAWAERLFIVVFGAIHLVAAGIITAFRRTAV